MSTTAEPPPKAFSCIRCFERKVKCDKLSPCSNCAQSNVECVFRVPPAPRRRKRRLPEAALLARLQKYEELLKSNGINVDGCHSPPVSSTDTTLSPSRHSQQSTDHSYDINRHPAFLQYQESQAGQLLVDRGKSRFIENNLWASASTEIQPKEAIIEQYSDEEDELGSPAEESTDFMFGYTPSSNSIQQFHPSPDRILVLWQIFLENINPITKLLHQPTFQESLVRASSNLDDLSKGLEALMFSIYTAAVTSMEDKDCEIKLGETRKTLLTRYRHATRKALARARFVATSDIQVLQAFTLFLLIMRKDYDSRTTWTLAGVASRTAQGMGLHRDGTTLGVSPFETEMRRRLWWQISILDFRSAELSGTGRFREFTLSDTRPPSNVDDAEIFPDMKKPPTPQAKATEMIACLLRCEFSCFWKEKVVEKANAAFENIRILLPHATTLEERDERINELERRIEEKYLRYCDPTIPIQFMSILIGRATIDGMRFMAHHDAKAENIPPSEREFLWNICIKIVEGDNFAHTTKAVHRFAWHTDVYFQWQALIYLLYELRTHTLGDKVDTAWELVSELFTHHSNFITDNRKPLHVAVGSLCVKAYNAREAALRETTRGDFPKVIPEYIKILREQRKHTEAAVIEPGHKSNEATTGVARAMIASPLRGESPSNPTTSNNTFQQLPASQHLAMFQQQLPLPTFPPLQVAAQTQNIPLDQFMFASDTELAQDLAMAGIPMDWVQWDYVTQEFEQAR